MTQTATAPTLTPNIARAIIRCTAKGCRTAHTVEFATTYEVFEFGGRPATRRNVIVDGRTRQYRDRHDLASIVSARFTCTGCGGSGATFDVIEGRFSETVKCGPRCRNAVGPSCDCQCGGENHAAGHAVC